MTTNRFRRCGGIVFVTGIAAAMVLAGGGLSAQSATPKWESSLAWKASAIGGAADKENTHEWNAKDGVLNLTGSGVGVDVNGADQCRFVYIDRQAGDFEIIVRLAEWNEGADVENTAAGIMVRGDSDAADGPMTVLFGRVKGELHQVLWTSRSPAVGGERPATLMSGIDLAEKAPLWMRLVRVGKNFAAYKSRDGQRWAMMTNRSGGPLEIDGPLRVGEIPFQQESAMPILR